MTVWKVGQICGNNAKLLHMEHAESAMTSLLLAMSGQIGNVLPAKYATVYGPAEPTRNTQSVAHTMKVWVGGLQRGKIILR